MERYFSYICEATDVQADWRRSKWEVPRDVRIQTSGYKTSSEEIGLDIKTYASPKVGQD